MATRTCPFPDCDWEHKYDAGDYTQELEADSKSESHYEDEHAGRVKIQVTLEQTQLLGDRDPKEIRERILDEKADDFGSYEVAHVRTEVLEEADDHSQANRRGGPGA